MRRLPRLLLLGVAAVAVGACSVGPGGFELPDADPDALACVADEPCSTNPGNVCLLGKTSCSTGVAVCDDDRPKPDGTSCNSTWTCALGDCLPPTTISTSVNLTTDSITPGRTCDEAPMFAVSSLTSTTATVATAPVGDCLVAGDEVMLINLQGTSSATVNVGNWELLRIAGVSGTEISFTGSKTRSYGASLDDNIGTNADVAQHRVGILRVPRFGVLTVEAGATITASGWNGAVGGIVAIRAGSFVIDGTITAVNLGYRSGRWSQGGPCYGNLPTETGESISGPPLISTARNTGGPGGIGANNTTSFIDNTPICPSAGHALDGQPGRNANGRTLGEPGAAYGVADGTRLTMGSGSAGNMTCIGGGSSTVYVTKDAPPGGGIVALVGGDLQLGPTSSVTATATPVMRDVTSSGGYVYLRGHHVSLGTSRVTARGAIANGGSTPTQGMFNVASPGYIAIQASGTVTGITDPAAVIVP